ncbi:hypothetical protein Zmor_023887 [Zophobas morio]|uniref:DUF4817 domain-containing protein n=1 Tax=Zophobas morio TaxID=2755281 RepID=A0AA38M6V5_9CUCU|nr:hypothetical protein Zmor_023887 [Zophobas morio]
MAMYTNIERTDMVLIYGEARGNAEEARRIYMERFPQRLAPAAGTFIKNVQHLRDHGTFKPQTQDRGRVRTRRILDVEPQILHTVEAEPGISTRRLAVRHGISQFIAWRTLKEQGLHPYHVQKVQALQPGDPARQQVFCRWLFSHSITETILGLHFDFAIIRISVMDIVLKGLYFTVRVFSMKYFKK